MMNTISFCLILAVGITNADGSRLSRAIDSYGFQLLKNSKHENAVLSPRSIGVTLFMPLLGSGGSTNAEILLKVFDNMTEDEIIAQMKPLVSFTNYSEATVQSATALLANANKNLGISSWYWRRIWDLNITQIQADTDFKNDQTRLEINEENVKIRNQIKELIAQSLWDNNAALILLNKIYFKANWAYRFDPEWNMDAAFFNLAGRKKTAHVMVQRNAFFGYYTTDWYSVLEIPYKEATLTAYFFLTKRLRQFESLQHHMSGKMLEELVGLVKNTEMGMVQLPRFEIKSTFDLKSLMKSTGVNSMFTNNANLSRMCRQSVMVSEAKHSASIEVTEEGTEATADTSMTIVERMASRSRPSFIVQHPFVFVVYDTAIKSALFIGRYVEPSPLL